MLYLQWVFQHARWVNYGHAPRSKADFVKTFFAIWALCTLALLPVLAKAANDSIYHYRKDGARTYTDRKPLHGPYATIAKYGRPVASASCRGLTAASLQSRAKDYEPLIVKHAKQHGVPPALVSAVMRVESCYDQRAVSRVGARGLMQLMPQTAKELGVRNSFDADQNIGGGVRYLSLMLKRFNNDLNLALAAYNAGPNAVEKHKGIPPFKETQHYVARITKLYQPPPTVARK